MMSTGQRRKRNSSCS